MPAAMPVTTKITQSSQKTIYVRTLAASFGDGYVQTAPNGTNSVYEEWSVGWGQLTLAERNTVVSTLLAVGSSDYLTWTPPGDSTEKKYQVIPGNLPTLYSEQMMAGQYYNITTNLRQVF